jgi:hypothetical protein
MNRSDRVFIELRYTMPQSRIAFSELYNTLGFPQCRRRKPDTLCNKMSRV